MKTCRVCRLDKALEDFTLEKRGKHGRSTICKPCQKLKTKEINSRPETRERKRAHANLESSKLAQRLYRSRPENLQKQGIVTGEYAKRNRHKKSAQLRLGRAVKSGQLKKLPCEVCGEEKSQGHHSDYSKPLEVMWLCHKHHTQWHVEHKKEYEETNGKWSIK